MNMRQRRWPIAILGVMLAVAGGIAEQRHHIVVGGLSAVFGLLVWVLFSGSTALDLGTRHLGKHGADGDRAAETSLPLKLSVED